MKLHRCQRVQQTHEFLGFFFIHGYFKALLANYSHAVTLLHTEFVRYQKKRLVSKIIKPSLTENLFCFYGHNNDALLQAERRITQ